MINLNEYIVEKLKLDDNIEVNNTDLDDLLLHFEFDEICQKNLISKSDAEEIKNKLDDFIARNNCKKENSKYYTNRGRKFTNNKVNKDYVKNNNAWMTRDRHFKNDDIMWKGEHGLYFKANDEHKLLAMCGPYGGIKICQYE